MEEEKTSHVGETSVLECMASGSPRPRLQWLKDARPLQKTPRHFFTADNQLLIIVETVWDDAGTYTCEMSNTLGIMRGVTRLKVLSADGQVRVCFCVLLELCVGEGVWGGWALHFFVVLFFCVWGRGGVGWGGGRPGHHPGGVTRLKVLSADGQV